MGNARSRRLSHKIPVGATDAALADLFVIGRFDFRPLPSELGCNGVRHVLLVSNFAACVDIPVLQDCFP